jgi:hypothetical protein
MEIPVTDIISGEVKFRKEKVSGEIIVGVKGVFSKTVSFIGIEN